MKRLLFVSLLAGLLAMAGRCLAGDTGTYRILDYSVVLTPRSDGTVTIDYYQKWLVTGGHIPWITVGTPNSEFTITSSQGAVARIGTAGESGWSGVRIDLDRDYRPGQTFEARFSVVQRKLFYASKENYGLDFTPGWYDRAVTDTLRVRIKFFASLETVRANPRPSRVSNDELTWEKYGMGPGERFSVHVSFPVGAFPSGIVKENLKGSRSRWTENPGVFAILFLAVIFLVVIVSLSSSARRYSGGRMFYGGIPGGTFGRGGSGGHRSSGGGGGFGGASISCACACVSCACACACAGGGGAGCSRKLEHTCPVCRQIIR